MIDITRIRIREIFIHRVGNLLRNEGVLYSKSPQKIPVEDTLSVVQFLFGHIDRLNTYIFTHSVNAEFNAVRALANSALNKKQELKKLSSEIAAHLYSVSNHPRVKAGNLFIGIFDGVFFEGKSHTVLGIFKSDTVDDFIKVEIAGNKALLRVEQGAAVSSLDKISLIFPNDSGGVGRVFAASSRGEDAIFWNERFLQLDPCPSAKVDTKDCLDICRAFATQGHDKLEDPEMILFLNRSLQFFEEADHYSEKSFDSVFGNKIQEKEFKKFKDKLESGQKRNIPKDFKIEKSVVRKERSKFEKNVILDSNIEIRLRFKNYSTMQERVEQGFDQKKGLAFFKLYYSIKK